METIWTTESFIILDKIWTVESLIFVDGRSNKQEASVIAWAAGQVNRELSHQF